MDSRPSFRDTPDAPRQIQQVIADPAALRIVTQPILDLVSGRIAGYEALSRFDRPPRWTPDRWFQCARHCGLGAGLEAAAVGAALSVPCRPATTFLTLNVSPSTLGTRALGAVLPCDLSGLMFELTENEPISGDPTLPTTIRNYRRRGAHFALDDVGAGHAQLADVRLVEPELIKLDRSLLTDLERDPVRAAAVEAFIHAAISTGAHVCAEGVETLQQLRWLHRAGVSHVQGYLVGRPETEWAAETGSLDDMVRRTKTPALLDRLQTPRPRRRSSLPDSPARFNGRSTGRLRTMRP